MKSSAFLLFFNLTFAEIFSKALRYFNSYKWPEILPIYSKMKISSIRNQSRELNGKLRTYFNFMRIK